MLKDIIGKIRKQYLRMYATNTTKYVEEVMTALGSAADDRFKTE
jgi:hypothetical protein